MEENKRQQKRDRLKREMQYARTNRKILKQKWRNTQMEILEPYLKLQYQIAVNKSEEILDLKDYQISLLLDELDECDEQYNENFRGHMQNINKVFDYFQVILNDLKKEYETSFSNLMYRAMHERCKMEEKFNSDSEHLNVMIYRLVDENKKMCSTLQSEYTAKIKLEQKTTENEIEIMQEKKHKTFMNIWDMCTNIVKEYHERAKEQEKEYTYLHEQNTFYQNEIKNQTLHLFHCQESLCKLKDGQEAEKDIWDNDIKYKIAERDFFKKIYEKLRSYYEEDIKFDGKQLTHLVTHSNIILKDLSKMVDHGEKIVKQYSFITKYETQREKYLPFPKAMPHDPHKHDDELRRFWMKCGQIDAARHVIKEEYQYLKHENDFYKKVLQNYCSGFAANCTNLQDQTLHFQCNIK